VNNALAAVGLLALVGSCVWVVNWAVPKLLTPKQRRLLDWEPGSIPEDHPLSCICYECCRSPQ
jgi:hypothetical protein